MEDVADEYNQYSGPRVRIEMGEWITVFFVGYGILGTVVEG